LAAVPPRAVDSATGWAGTRPGCLRRRGTERTGVGESGVGHETARRQDGCKKTARCDDARVSDHPITPSSRYPRRTRLLDLALAEDIGGGDITSTLTVAAGRQARERLLAKAAGIISGLDVAGEVFRRVDASVVFTPLVTDGEAVAAMTPIATIEGPARSLLAGERVSR
jgi:Quinolinate phosphoribosyl transferase, N-terminal domain